MPLTRRYWEKSYSGGPIDVKTLSAVLPGKGYKPLVVPNGGALPFKLVDGVKVFNLIAEEVAAMRAERSTKMRPTPQKMELHARISQPQHIKFQ